MGSPKRGNRAVNINDQIWLWTLVYVFIMTFIPSTNSSTSSWIAC